MTSIEHALLGINSVVAGGLDRRYGWQLAALAGAAAMIPDWDGLTILFGADLFADAHRVWGHNIIACVIIGVVLGAADHRLDLATPAARWLVSILPLAISAEQIPPRRTRSWRGGSIWVFVAVAAAASHLVADLLFSGTATLSDWHLKLLWPFSERGWIYPMVPWGDPGATVVMVAGMLAMARSPSRRRPIAALTLAAVTVYILVRGVIA